MEETNNNDYPPPNSEEIAALERLIQVATSEDAMAHGSTHQSLIVADFLLAWWDAVNCGYFDLSSLWAVDAVTVADMQTVFGMIARVRVYPDVLGYEDRFKEIVRRWRPD
ncbi:MAG: hypothetical protein LBR05_08895, partial [Azoarcus sp.]|nr:hypothetical protein [Azoarcus sp.]